MLEHTEITPPTGADLVTSMERAIRDYAGTTISAVINRRDHPSYGYTKTMINESLQNMEGAIGMYMLLTGQSGQIVKVSHFATFTEDETTERVATARRLVKEMK